MKLLKKPLNYLKEKLGFILEKIKASKGFMTAKGAYINYREAHKIQYGIVLGLMIMRPGKLQDRIRANDLDFLEWESTNSHYVDKSMLITYILKWAILLDKGFFEVLRYALLGA